MKRKKICTFTRSETVWRNMPDRVNPIMWTRFIQVDVYRFGPWDFLGLFDKHVERPGPWGEYHKQGDVA